MYYTYSQASIIRGTWEQLTLRLKTADNRVPLPIEARIIGLTVVYHIQYTLYSIQTFNSIVHNVSFKAMSARIQRSKTDTVVSSNTTHNNIRYSLLQQASTINMLLILVTRVINTYNTYYYYL